MSINTRIINLIKIRVETCIKILKLKNELNKVRQDYLENMNYNDIHLIHIIIEELEYLIDKENIRLNILTRYTDALLELRDLENQENLMSH